MNIIEIEEIKENIGIGANNEDATFKLKLSHSKINGISFRLFKEKNTNNLILVIMGPKGNNFIIKANNLNEIKLIAIKLILNLEYLNANKRNTNISLKNTLTRKNISLVYKSISGVAPIEGTFIDNINDLEIGGQSLQNIEDIIPSLLAKITTSEDTIDFSLNEYSLITKCELFKNLIEEDAEYTEDEIASINQYKAGTGPEIYACNALRKDKLYYNDNFYIEEIKRLEKLFNKAPKLRKDIILYRGGSGEYKNNEYGSINLYDGLISFSIDRSVGENYATGNRSNTLYKMKLPKGIPCLGLFYLNGLEGMYIEETEVLMPSFLYQVIDRKENHNYNFTKLDISYIGKISITDLLYERLKRSRQYPKLKLNNTKEELVCNSPEDLLSYAKKGYDYRMVTDYSQLDIIDTLRYLYDKNIMSEMRTQINKIRFESLNYISALHGLSHIQRVYFLAILLAELDDLTIEERKLLIAAVKYHNIGRDNDNIDEETGKKSANKLRTNIDRLKEFSKEDQELILFVIEQHSKSTLEIEEALQNLPQENQAKYRKILSYLKDANMLDNPRLETNKMIDINSLNIPTSKRLVFLSYELDKYYPLIFHHIQELDTQLSKLPDINNTIELIEKTEYERTKSELMTITNRILDGEPISNQTDSIPVNSILEATKDISILNAKTYFKELLERITNRFKRGKKNGK